MENENNVTSNEVDVEVINESKGKSKKPIIIGISVAVLVIIGVAVAIVLSVFSPSARYNKANGLLEAKKYDEAIAIYQELDNYKDSKDKVNLCNFEKALLLIKEENYVDAKSILINLDTNEEIAKNLKVCNHMILYNYVLKNGTAYKGVHYVENPDTGLNIQVKNDDKTIRAWYEYYIDSAIMYTTFAFPLESKNIEVSYFMELGGSSYQGSGVFYPYLFDGNLDNTPGKTPENSMVIASKSQGLELGIDDIKYSPYMNINFDHGGVDGMAEIAALRYYVDFSSNLETLSNHIEYIDCGVSISDFGIVLK